MIRQRLHPITSSGPFFVVAVILGIVGGTFLMATDADDTAEPTASAQKRRREISLGGDFKPNPTIPAFVAVGHGGRILLSRDDGQTWRQVYWGHPGSDHGLWATKSVAYSNGVFVVPIGWGAATAWLASEDGEHWRHLTNGLVKLADVKDAKDDPTAMPASWAIAGGKEGFVSGGYMTMGAAVSTGESIRTFSLYKFSKELRPRKLVTHHVEPIYCGDQSGRFLALGNDRSSDNPVFGNLFASDDQGATWKWLEPELLNEKCDGYSGFASNGTLVLIADKLGRHAYTSSDAGDTWQGPFPTGVERTELSVVGKEFWLVGSKSACASMNGKDWRALPTGIPAGKIVSSPTGTLISIHRQRFNILRSIDNGETWQEVHSFKPETAHVHGAQGLRDIVFGHLTVKP